MSTFAAEALARSPLLLTLYDDTSGTTAADSSGNSRPGTLHNGVALNQPGGPNQNPSSPFFAFDGADDYVSYAYSPFASGGQRTFMIAYNRTGHADADTLLSTAGGGTMLRLDAGSQQVTFFPDTATSSTAMGTSPGDGVWVLGFLLFNDSGSGVSYNGGTFAAHNAELYLNNVSGGRKTGVAPMAAAGNLSVGVRGTSVDPFAGGIALVGAFTGLLTPADIAAITAALAAPSGVSLMF